MDEMRFVEMTRDRVTLYDAREGPKYDAEYSISNRAYKALRGAQKGDRVEVSISYGGYPYRVTDAERITGTLRERVEVLEGTLEDLLSAISTTASALSDAGAVDYLSQVFEDRRRARARAVEEIVLTPRKLTLDEMKGSRRG